LQQDVPLRSRFGNSLTRLLFRWRYRVDIKDTQTGLRGIPKDLLQIFLGIPFNNYEFEMACLMQAVKRHYPIQQITIQTVYLNNNIGSHFNPVIDSVRIYYVFLRYVIIAFLSYVIDFTVFVLIYLTTKKLFWSLLIARIISSSFNFYQNKFLVFRSQHLQLLPYQVLSYFSLATVNFIISYLGILWVVHLGVRVVSAKLLVDTLVFVILFLIQRKFIFRNTGTKNHLSKKR
jgi:putative flippase GtrA